MESLPNTKLCNKCEIEKDVEEFGIVRSNPDGRRYCCKTCWNRSRKLWGKRRSEVLSEQKKRHHKKHRERYLAYSKSDKKRALLFAWKLNRYFGITPDGFIAIGDRQGWVCPICSLPPTEANGHRLKAKLHVDHDHKTGKVRGLLCNNCNAALGYFADNIERLMNAIEYLTDGNIPDPT